MTIIVQGMLSNLTVTQGYAPKTVTAAPVVLHPTKVILKDNGTTGAG